MSEKDESEKLFLRQKETLDTFLRCGAISAVQYKKSLYCLAQKMNMTYLLKEEENK